MPELAKTGAVELVRVLFLKRAAQLKPSVSDDLSRNCLPRFNDLGPDIQQTVKLSSLRSDRRFASLKRALEKWAQDHHLEADWCYERALEQLSDWCTPVPEGLEELQEELDNGWGGIRVSLEVADNSLKPPNGFSLYVPGAHSRSEYLDECKQIIEAELNRPPLSFAAAKTKRALCDSILETVKAYCVKVESWFKSNMNWSPVSIKQNLDRNLTWAVKIQVIGKTASEIRQEYTRKLLDLTTITRAVREVLEYIELPIRPDFRQGRKQKSKTQYPRRDVGR